MVEILGDGETASGKQRTCPYDDLFKAFLLLGKFHLVFV